MLLIAAVAPRTTRAALSALTCCVLLGVTSPVSARAAGGELEVAVRGVDPVSMTWLIATQYRVNLVAAPAVQLQRERGDVHGAYPSPEALIRHLTSRQRRSVGRKGSILFIPSHCSAAGQRFGARSNDLITFQSERAPLNAIPSIESLDPPTAGGWVSVTVNQVSPDDLAAAVTASAGRPGLRPGSRCDSIVKYQVSEVLPALRHDNCPYRKASAISRRRPACTPLEFYALQSLVPRGYVRHRGKIGAVLESPEGRLSLVHSGDHVGRAYGTVTEVDETGFSVREVYRDKSGDPVQAVRKFRYGAPHAVHYPRPLDYIDDDSPQSVYDNAVISLAAKRMEAEAGTLVCAQRSPASAQSLRAAWMDWQSRNEPLLGEIRNHEEAYAERVGEALGRSMASVAKDHHDSMRASVIKALQDEQTLILYCATLRGSLEDPRSDIDHALKAEVAVVRGCSEHDACPNLRPSR